MAPIGLLLSLALAQHTHASGAVTVSTKGISLIPALTLGKPAAIFDVAITNRAFGFEPQFRFGLDGKPWSFIFWGRYRPVRTGPFQLTIGAHPSFNFRTVDGAIVTRRYLAGDLFPSYGLTPNLRVGPYYFYAHGLDPASFQHTHFAGARAYLNNVRIPGPFVIHFAPQLYYLWMDREDGVYVTSVLTLGHRRLPFALSTLLNSPLRSSIAGGQEFLWNLSLTYAMR